MASVWKPSRIDPTTGRRVKVKRYQIIYKDEQGRRRKARGFQDKAASLELARKLERDVERRKAGLPTADLGESHQPIASHIEKYIADLARRGRSRAYLTAVRKALELLQRECDWPCIATIRADKLGSWLAGRAANGRGARTQNYYRDALHAFLSFCCCQKWLPENPITRYSVPKLKVTGKHRKRRRRAFTEDEFRRLLAAAKSERRQLLYAIAGLSGLRRAEMRRLERRDVDLSEPDRPLWKLRAEVTKSGEAETVPMLHECLPFVLRLLELTGPEATARLFPSWPDTRSRHRDLKRAGITRIGEDGRCVDFHSLRYLFCTMLARRIPIGTVQLLMRHRDIRLTVNIYRDLSLTDIAEQVLRLPKLIDWQETEKNGAPL
jgi:integrase